MSTKEQIDTLYAAVGNDATRQRALDQCLLDRATELARSGDVGKAEALFSDLLSRDAPLPSAMDLKARLLVPQGRFLEAEQLWTRVLEAEPDHPTARKAVARLHVLQRRAFWFARPSTRLILTVIACALAMVPFWWLGSQFSRGEHATRDALTSLAATHHNVLSELVATNHNQQEKATDARHTEILRRVDALAASVDPLSTLAKSSAERGTALANAQQQAAASIAKLTDTVDARHADLLRRVDTLAATVGSLSTFTKSSAEHGAALANAQQQAAASVSKLTETAAALELRQNQVTATLDTLQKATAATTQSVQQNQKANAESLAALPNLISDKLNRREESLRAATTLPLPAFKHDGVTVSGDRSRQQITFVKELFSEDGQLTPESSALLKSLASSLASIPNHPALEVVAVCAHGASPQERAALITRLAIMADAISAANSTLGDLPLRIETVSDNDGNRPASSYLLQITPSPR